MTEYQLIIFVEFQIMYTLWQAHNSQETQLASIPENLSSYTVQPINMSPAIGTLNRLVVVDGTNITQISPNLLLIGEQLGTPYQAQITTSDSTLMFECVGTNPTNDYIFMSGDVISDTFNGSQTITHKTEFIGNVTPGCFCESTGEIYYMKPRTTKSGEIIEWEPFEDCIAKIKQSESLNKNILGVITHISGDKLRFATHGDVLVKVIPGTYALGDIIIPTTGGFGKKATEQEVFACSAQGIPKLKVTSTVTKIESTVACMFI